MTVPRWMILRAEILLDKTVEKIRTHFMPK
jgi:hypothetical protein